MPGILGIDPGVNGALALFRRDVIVGPDRWFIQDLPEKADKLRHWFRQLNPTICYLEQTWHHKIGTHASYKLGERTGWILGILECCDVPVTRAHPSAWKRALGLLHTNKADSLALAREIVGNVPELSMKKHHNRAEAALIAHYGALRYGGLL